MSQQLVIIEESPKKGAQMSKTLYDQGHRMCIAYIRGGDETPKHYHCTPKMLENAEYEKKAAKASGTAEIKPEEKKAAPVKAAAKKAAPKKAAVKK